eukprot:g23471.t1
MLFDEADYVHSCRGQEASTTELSVTVLAEVFKGTKKNVSRSIVGMESSTRKSKTEWTTSPETSKVAERSRHREQLDVAGKRAEPFDFNELDCCREKQCDAGRSREGEAQIPQQCEPARPIHTMPTCMLPFQPNEEQAIFNEKQVV